MRGLSMTDNKKRPGRPRKDGVNLHCQLSQDTKDAISKLADQRRVSQGDIVAMLLKHYQLTKEVDDEYAQVAMSYFEVDK